MIGSYPFLPEQIWNVLMLAEANEANIDNEKTIWYLYIGIKGTLPCDLGQKINVQY